MTRSTSWLAATVGSALADALALAYPVDCAGCGHPDVSLCDACRGTLTPQAAHVAARRVLASGVTVWSGLRFEGVAARVIRALKEEGRTSLARPLARSLMLATEACVREAVSGSDEVALVAVPTSRSAFRRRGFRVVDTIARHAGLRPARLLIPARATADQRALGRAARRGNVAGSMRARDATGRRIVILDDVVTTGATIDEAARALSAAGAIVLGAATVAATPMIGRRRGSGHAG